MKTKQIIRALRNFGSHFVDAKLANEAASRLELFSAEQKKLHAKLAAMKEERDAAIRELRHLSACATCARNGVECHMDVPVAESDICCGSYEWRGAKDTNVPSKYVPDINVGHKEGQP